MIEKSMKCFCITGGVYPGHYRSTMVSIECDTLDNGYNCVRIWCNNNFKDWNNIVHCPSQSKALFNNIKVVIPIHLFVSRKK